MTRVTHRAERAGAALAVLITALLAASPSARAQAWIREPGHAYAKLGYRLIRASSLYGPDGQRRPVGDGYRQHALGFYTEVGVVPRWLALSLDGDLFRRSVLVQQGATAGLGDLRIGAYTGLLTAPFRLALGVQVGLPTGDPSPSAGAGASVEDQFVARALPTGDGELDVALRVYAGHSFHGGRRWPFAHYVIGELGLWARGLAYRQGRPEGLSAGEQMQLVYRAELGTSPVRERWDRLQLVLRLVGVTPFRNSGVSSTVGLGASVRFVSPGVELSVRVASTFRLGFSADGAIVAANVPAGVNWQLYVSAER
ncbi:MAG: hypothetical protein KC668_10735 [Myxococcales bacterium]|nr:hypothetical protein [Myxococcales bacterium]